MPPAPELSVVIPTLGRSPALAGVLSSLATQAPDTPPFEVLLVADAAAAEVTVLDADAPASPSPLLRQRTLSAALPGASAARNVGWQAAAGEHILFLDDDIVPVPRLVLEHMAWHRRNPQPEVGVAGLVRWSPRVRVSPFMRWLETGIQFDFGSLNGEQIPWTHFYSCNVSVKRQLLERAGGFDEARFPYGYEDLELGRRLRDLGLRLLFNRRAVGLHEKTETLDGWRRNLSRIARAERRFTRLYPDARPYFYERFRAAADSPPARGRAARLAGVVSPRLPWLGARVWRSYDLVCTQSLAPQFLAEWEAAEAEAT